jgi:hypothetical protein
MKYGLEGYGLYWYCLELIAADVDQHKLTFELEHDAEIIAFDTGIHYERVNEMMAYMVNLNLFESNNGVLSCIKLASRLDKSMTSNPMMRKMLEDIRSNHDKVMTQSDKTMQDKTRLDETRLDKDMSPSAPVTHEKKPSKQFVKPTPEELVSYFQLKDSTAIEAEKFFHFYESKGWFVGKNKMKVWRSSASLWIGKNKSTGQQVAVNNNQSFDDALKRTF